MKNRKVKERDSDSDEVEMTEGTVAVQKQPTKEQVEAE